MTRGSLMWKKLKRPAITDTGRKNGPKSSPVVSYQICTRLRNGYRRLLRHLGKEDAGRILIPRPSYVTVDEQLRLLDISSNNTSSVLFGLILVIRRGLYLEIALKYYL